MQSIILRVEGFFLRFSQKARRRPTNTPRVANGRVSVTSAKQERERAGSELFPSVVQSPSSISSRKLADQL